MAQGLLLSFKKASKLRLIKVNEREREREREGGREKKILANISKHHFEIETYFFIQHIFSLIFIKLFYYYHTGMKMKRE